ncbi:MAG TPA: prepilin-type N-terminal cleavage/methylation domain-containing protein [Polyangiaceae bacterium]
MQQARRTARQRRSQSGFTLVELMVIVIIVSILALLGTYSVRKYVSASKTSEATEMIATIKSAQESYKDETFAYLNVSATLDAYYPANPNAGRVKIQWGGADVSLANWQALGVHAASPVLFQYSCVAGPSGAVAAPGGALSDITVGNWPATVSSPWYVVKAEADFEGNGRHTVFVGSSFYGEIFAAGN